MRGTIKIHYTSKTINTNGSGTGRERSQSIFPPSEKCLTKLNETQSEDFKTKSYRPMWVEKDGNLGIFMTSYVFYFKVHPTAIKRYHVFYS